MKGINYVALAKKYFGVDMLCDDRTYEGLKWSLDSEKPSKEVFDSLQREEERLARIEGRKLEEANGEILLKQKQARLKAEQDAIPLEQKIREVEEKAREEVFKLRQEAVQLQQEIATANEVLLAWYEISKTQHKINEEAKQYLLDTAAEVERYKALKKKLPKEIEVKREEAAKRIKDGELVFKHYDLLRAKEMPTREEIQEAIKKGGEWLKEMKETCRAVQLKYPKPKVKT